MDGMTAELERPESLSTFLQSNGLHTDLDHTGPIGEDENLDVVSWVWTWKN